MASILYPHIVSGSISSPSRGAFHLSLTVLVHYRSLNIFSLGRWSSQIQAGFLVSDPTQEHSRKIYIFCLRDYHPLWSHFPELFCYIYKFHIEVLQPPAINHWVWAVPLSLATTKGISIDFSTFATKMFQFAKCPQNYVIRHYPDRVPPFGNPRVKAC